MSSSTSPVSTSSDLLNKIVIEDSHAATIEAQYKIIAEQNAKISALQKDMLSMMAMFSEYKSSALK